MILLLGRLTTIVYERPGSQVVRLWYQGEIRTTITQSRGLGYCVASFHLSKRYAMITRIVSVSYIITKRRELEGEEPLR